MRVASVSGCSPAHDLGVQRNGDGAVPLGLVDPGVGSGLNTGNRREPFISLFPLKAAHAGRNTTVGSYGFPSERST